MPLVSVRLRTSPFSAGTVTMSPRKSNTARAPEGESDALLIHFAPVTNRSRVSRTSDGTANESFRDAPVAVSSKCRYPACS